MSIGILRGEPDEVHKIHLARVNALAAGLRAERAKSAELLAALAHVLSLTPAKPGWSRDYDAALDQARAVIARATGGEP